MMHRDRVCTWVARNCCDKGHTRITESVEVVTDMEERMAKHQDMRSVGCLVAHPNRLLEFLAHAIYGFIPQQQIL